VLTITPICPHTLSNRSVIVRMDSMVQVTVLSERVETMLTADGQVQTPLNTGDFVQMRQSKLSVRLLRLPGSSFFETLRQKLHWSGSHV
jgi:NAD+ kinase